MMKSIKFLLLCLTFNLYACGTSDIKTYNQTQPKFNLFEYFEGHVEAYGLVENRQGEVVRRFHVDIKGEVTNRTLVLTEDFIYDDGEKEQRIWTITKDGDAYQGRAADVIGRAQGLENGFALRWQYQMNLKVKDKTYKVGFDDWMYRLDDEHVFNKAKIKKFGFVVAEVTLFFRKLN